MKAHSFRYVVTGLTMAATAASMALVPATAGAAVQALPARPAHTAMSSPSGMADFGPGCASVPKTGAGSFSGMTSAPVAAAASHNPVLSTLVSAVKKAGLVDTLNNAKALTVFAPDNAAFAKVPKATLTRILANKSELAKLLEYHVVGTRISPSQLAGRHMTIEGSGISVAGSGTTFNINGVAQVVCGNVQTANATVYIVNRVLVPSSM